MRRRSGRVTATVPGLLLLVLALAPGELLLVGADQGIRGNVAVGWGQAHRAITLWGVLVLLGVSGILARLAGDRPVRPVLAAAGRALRRPGRLPFALLAGGLSFGLALAVQRGVYEGLLTNVDDMAVLVQARYFAAGQLTGALPADPAFWLFLNTLVTPAGWVSIYPPGHLAVVAGGVLLAGPGAALLVGPALNGVGVTAYALAAERLLPGRPAVARLGALLLALSPLLAIHGGQLLSHGTSFAAGGLALYGSLRARDGGRWGGGWGVVAGLAWALMVAARPWTGFTVGSVLVLGPWLADPSLRRDLRALLRRGASVVVGGLLPGGLFLAYHDAVFGSPATLGYDAAFGPRHGLGFHTDPWGMEYGLVPALGYTASDMAVLGVQLLESPLSPLLLVGAWLLWRAWRARRASPAEPEGGSRPPPPRGGLLLLLAWALVPVAANLVYWFHAARMYIESVPAWCLLTAMAAVEVAGGEEGLRRSVATWLLLLAVAAAPVLTAERLERLAWDEETRVQVVEPPALPDGPSLVFVHTSWRDRIGRTLEAGGMRGDSAGIVLRLRDPCDLWHEALERRRGGGVTTPSDECERQLRADRFGTVALAPLLWQGDLPGLPARGAMYVRDLGPSANRALIDRMPERTPLMLRGGGEGAPPVLESYRAGEAALWE